MLVIDVATDVTTNVTADVTMDNDTVTLDTTNRSHVRVITASILIDTNMTLRPGLSSAMDNDMAIESIGMRSGTAGITYQGNGDYSTL